MEKTRPFLRRGIYFRALLRISAKKRTFFSKNNLKNRPLCGIMREKEREAEMLPDYKGLKSGTDVRGVALEGVPGEEINLTDEAVSAIVKAFCLRLAERTGKQRPVLAVGHDSRPVGGAPSPPAPCVPPKRAAATCCSRGCLPRRPCSCCSKTGRSARTPPS